MTNNFPVPTVGDLPIPDDVASFDYGQRVPYGKQLSTVTAMVTHMRGYNLNALGTGKTFCTLSAFLILRQRGIVGRMLVVAKNTNLEEVWVPEIFKVYSDRINYQVLTGDKKRRLKRLGTDADVYIINHEGFSSILADLAWRVDIDALCIDELAAYRNGGTRRVEDMRALVARKKWAWGLTGSPMPRAVTDVWAQCSILTPMTVPKYFSHFQHTMQYKVGPFRWEDRAGATEAAVKVMTPSVRYTRDDMVELPPAVTKFMDIPMGKKQAVVYQTLKSQAVAMVGTAKIDALNAGAILDKLLQVALGWVYTRDGQTVTLDNEARINAIIDTVDEAQEKTIVLVPYLHALDGICKAMDDAGMAYYRIQGETLPAERTRIINAFQNNPGREPLVAHPICISHGLTLTAADTIVWMGPTRSLEYFQQANGRITRIGQKHKQNIFLVAGSTVEKNLYRLLNSNDVRQEHFLQIVASETE